MIKRIKNKVAGKISNIVRGAVRNAMMELLPILIPQLLEFQNSRKEDRTSNYDHTKDPFENISFYESLKDRLMAVDIPVESVDIDISDFERWLGNFPGIRKFYKNMGDAFIEKCMEHYLTFRHFGISDGDIYIDIASGGSPWAEILNAQRGVKAYRLDLSYPEGIAGIHIGADAGNTNLPAGFASVLSLHCA